MISSFDILSVKILLSLECQPEKNRRSEPYILRSLSSDETSKPYASFWTVAM